EFAKEWCRELDEVMSLQSFESVYKHWLPGLNAADVNICRVSVDMFQLYDPDTKFMLKDYYGIEVGRKPIIRLISDIYHDDWGPSLKRNREKKKTTNCNDRANERDHPHKDKIKENDEWKEYVKVLIQMEESPRTNEGISDEQTSQYIYILIGKRSPSRSQSSNSD
ncbi:hypothetical protein RFI_28484, partial [Reticulomyxa filosa]